MGRPVAPDASQVNSLAVGNGNGHLADVAVIALRLPLSVWEPCFFPRSEVGFWIWIAEAVTCPRGRTPCLTHQKVETAEIDRACIAHECWHEGEMRRPNLKWSCAQRTGHFQTQRRPALDDWC